MLEIVDKKMEDQVVVVDGMKLTVGGYWDKNGYVYASGWVGGFRPKKTVVYVNVKDESLGENLMNRRHRPYELYRKIVYALMQEVGIDGKLVWSQNAGCTCACSPGFFLTESTHEVGKNWTLWVNVEKSDELLNDGYVTPLEAYGFAGEFVAVK